MLAEHENLTVGEHAELHADKNVGELATWEAEHAIPTTDDPTWNALVEELTSDEHADDDHTEETH